MIVLKRRGGGSYKRTILNLTWRVIVWEGFNLPLVCQDGSISCAKEIMHKHLFM